MMKNSIRTASQLTYECIQKCGSLTPTQWTIYDYLFKHGPLTSLELHKEIGTGKSPRATTKELELLTISGCITIVGEKPNTNLKTPPPIYDVTSRTPDLSKVAAELLKRTEQANQRTKKPSKDVLTKAVHELLNHCRQQRDQHHHQFSQEFIELTNWLKTLI